MKKIIILLLIILLPKIICFSQNTSNIINQDSIVLITPEQLKYTNFIFVEHKKLLEENNLLNKQVQYYGIKNNYFIIMDSIKTSQIMNYENINNSYVLQINNLNSTIEKKNKTLLYWKIGGITISVGLILFLLLK